MIVIVALLAAAFAAVLRGGQLTALADLRLRLAWTGAFALLAQIALFEVIGHHMSLALVAVLHLCTYVPALAFVLANWQLPGLRLAVLGALMNVVAIAANGGVMPSTEFARAAAGIVEKGGPVNSGSVEDARFQFLGDIIGLSGPWPIRSVFSIGDVLIVIGGAVIIDYAARRMPRPERRRGFHPMATISTRRVAPDGDSKLTVSPADFPIRA